VVFVAGRHISDNILATYEILHSMNTNMKGKKGFMALKLDISKAYDRVGWSFLVEVMSKLGFDSRWIGLILKCISLVSYAVLINGEPHGHITLIFGIRQGNALSPYLFVLCTEALSAMLQHVDRKTVRAYSCPYC